jgi:signal peptide peptidase SppA
MTILDIVNGPWAITPEMLQEIQAIYATHLRGEKIDVASIEARLGRPLNNKKDAPYQVVDGVAIIDVAGPIAKKMNLFTQISGGVSSDLLARDFMAAMRDPAITGIILAIDSPGGTVTGTPELGDVIFGARGKKPVVAWTDGAMNSGAYWVGSAADAAYISSDVVQVGSIGVVMAHMDVSRREEQLGVKTTEITAGRYKRIASQYEPLSTEGRADMQAKVDYLYSGFVDAVAKHRGVNVEQVLSGMADGRIFIGRQAITAGLVDGVATLDQLIADMRDSRRNPKTVAATGVAAANPLEVYAMTIEEFRAQHPDLFAQIEATARQGYVAAADLQNQVEAAATAERARIQSVEAQLIPGHEALIASLKFDGKTTGDQAAAAVVAAEKGVRVAALAAMEAGAPPVIPAVEGQDADIDANLPIEERTKAQWDKSPTLRAEFGKYEAFLAYSKKAEAGGVRILGKK